MQTATPQDIATTTPLPVLGKSDPFKNVAKFFIESVCCLTVICLILEVIFGLSGIGEQEVLQIDKGQGYIPFTDKNVCWRKEGFSRCRFDNWGIPGTGRKIELEKNPAAKRIAMIGDSYVEALQVSPEKSACLVLEKKLNFNNPSSKVEVLNFGVQGHNLSQTYVRLKDFVIHFKPDIVVLPIRPFATYILPPNTSEGFLGARPNFYLDGSGKLIEDRTVQDIWLKSRSARRMENTNWLRKNSKLYGVLGKSMEQIENWKLSGGLLGNFSESSSSPTTSAKKTNLHEHNETISFWWPVADALIAAINDECKKNGAQLLVVRLPAVNGKQANLETGLLSKSVTNHQIPYVDTTDIFKKKIDNCQTFFFDTHFNEKGNQLFADQIFDGLSKLKN